MKLSKTLLLGATLLASTIMQAQAKTLILYFSQPENVALNQEVDGVSGASALLRNNQVLGSNQYIAQIIQQQTGGDLLRIETVQPYPAEHQPLLDFAQEEQRQNIRPKLKTLPDLSGYDTVFVGYPIWWYQMPMPLYSLFEQVDFSGKTVIPFTVHGGSRFSNSLKEIKRLQPNAKLITKGLAISRDDVNEQSTVEKTVEWVKMLGLSK
ncbi:flavodoxin [Bisgaard Taxon 10/6]|uniref:flavodoxin n=1 Tax=Exercitatus varius TaxID=67857 RepID=UPI00294AF99D|nr:flavodoxin [Exercitatus varius]MDG2960304.1 flavodoxin [Exercitatus varius]